MHGVLNDPAIDVDAVCRRNDLHKGLAALDAKSQIGPVSYTHLDVYKRQAHIRCHPHPGRYHRGLLFPAPGPSPERGRTGRRGPGQSASGCGYRPVSYTHLLPDIPALAGCEEEKLHKLWEGLGYYSRVRNLQKAAKIVCTQYGGQLPADYNALLALPGIGEYLSLIHI